MRMKTQQVASKTGTPTPAASTCPRATLKLLLSRP